MVGGGFWQIPLGGFSVNGVELAETDTTAILDTGEDVSFVTHGKTDVE